MFCTIWQHHKQIKLIFVRNRVTAYNKRNTFYEYNAIAFYPIFFINALVVVIIMNNYDIQVPSPTLSSTSVNQKNNNRGSQFSQ